MTKERILEILEGAKDKTGSIPMSLVRKAFENISNEPPWIPCNERLPEVNDTYLVCYEDATVLMDWFNGYWFFHQTNPAVEETGTIIAWMPRPEPYKEEGEQK